ncbi:NAD(P)-binding protein [Roseinatronobacter sp.]|uniref:NAD(P)-binding protein n=1 Tax=Roseinatronobacter sp. TaxID=1945755 RepID=UPI0025DA0765|nr:NAD(P)-binding protein [Roseibaca sp.]
MRKREVIILGSGFRGLAAAFFLSSKGANVVVLEKAPQFGGVLSGKIWEGFHLDYGCHLFDNNRKDITDFYLEMVEDDDFFVDTPVQYSSVLNGRVTHGLAIPDLSLLPKPLVSQALLELLEMVTSNSAKSSQTTLFEVLVNRFGDTASQLLAPSIEKVYGNPSKDLCRSALNQGLFKRVKLLPDDIGNLLKIMPPLDERIAVKADSNLNSPYPNSSPKFGRNFYPAKHGMSGFVRRAVDVLKSRGVSFFSSTGDMELEFRDKNINVKCQNIGHFSCDNIVSTLSPSDTETQILASRRLCDKICPIPMTLLYFKVNSHDISSVTYSHNFDIESIAFRISNAGSYGNQYDREGQTYICIECPTNLTEVVWENPSSKVKEIWQAVISSGAVKTGAMYDNFLILQTPRSYSVPLRGYEALENEVFDLLSTHYPRLINLSSLSFSKNEIVSDVVSKLEIL